MENKILKPVVLIILDGWGIAPDGPGNAVTQAKTPFFDHLLLAYPHTKLLASGEAVGLPREEDGNSETGHLNIGAGQIIFQELPRINMSIASGEFFNIPAFKAAATHVKNYHSKLHLLGLIGAGGVHSSLEHIYALLRFAKTENLEKVYIHLFTDGRDSPPSSANIYINQLKIKMKQTDLGKIATICGRYFAMDRDNHWLRTQKAYELFVSGIGAEVGSVEEGIQRSYQNGKTDEFIEPMVIDESGLVDDDDAVIFFNFRVDRPRQLTKAFVLPDFENLVVEKVAFDPYAERYGQRQYQLPKVMTTFKRKKVLKNLFFVTMTEYETGLPAQVAFVPEVVDFPLSRVLAERGLRQFHIAETEKERHVTYYFNGRRERPFPGEDWVEVPSSKVATYDQKPEMMAHEVTEILLKRLKLRAYDFIIVNFANPDMVGHTGVLKAGIKSCEVVDNCLEKVVKTIQNLGGVAVVTADHGNVEEMIELETGEVDTKHSTNPVPFIVTDEQVNSGIRVLPQGILADIAPTVLYLMSIEKPSLMTGRNLLK